MKSFLYLGAAIALTLIIVPVIAASDSRAGAETTTGASGIVTENGSSESDGVLSVYMSTAGNVINVSEFEYVCGAVAAEMPLSYHEEALKAQAVACYTNAVRLRSENNGKSSSIEGADISDSSSVHQGYLTENARREKWGDSFDKYEEKLKQCVSAVFGEKVTYKGEPCIAAFHAICTGVTEDSLTVWGEEAAYLKSVRSAGDPLSPSYASTVTFTPERMGEILGELELDAGKKKGTYFGNAKKSDAGTVTEIELLGKKFTGAEIRSAFSLRSAAFDVTEADGSVTFSVQGYGHGVGMSQYGANYMATGGSDYREILKHYYSGAEITG